MHGNASMQGMPGMPGMQGMQGNVSMQGMPGMPGMQGMQGNVSMQGMPGMPGMQGMPGMPGMMGMPGMPGMQGMPGMGMQGAPGTMGMPGMQGMQGMYDMNGQLLPSTLAPPVKPIAGAKRMPPELLLKSLPKLEGIVDLIEVDFQHHESPLGLVIEWSMPLPVISQVLPDTPAARRGVLRPGLVLMRINRRGLCPGELKRHQVEELLAARPLRLAFEAPEISPEFTRMGHPITPPGARFGGGPSEARRQRRMLFKPARGGPRPKMTKKSPEELARIQAEEDSREASQFFSLHPERKTLTRFGALERLPKRSSSMTALSRSDKDGMALSLPPVSPRQNSQKALMASTGGLGSTGRMSMTVTDMGSTTASFQDTGQWSGRRGPDACYEHIVKSGEPVGPGPHDEWPLTHDKKYVCNLKCFLPARCITDAYEPGYRGRKRKFHLKHYLMFKFAPRGVTFVSDTIEEITCDICGVKACTADDPGFFYYCKQCKKHGNRFDICMGCHANEILQAEGKHAGPEVHPHYAYCRHLSIIKKKNLSVAYNPEPLIWRVYCDYCGKVASRREDETKFLSCPRCPDAHGLRFEMCEECAEDLLKRGEGVEKVRAAQRMLGQ
eukprot:gnl/TRDRNA2_/TRDRNA2_175747_c1_seq3.p1 gnl/TRDRNA2_/TRDRNA2_175747_c1~~gnl/TRDRNA2_/TRDRNA2_175747_c1_seq3.p1  ORF type:complete len:694 (-),score=114.98 gnl/TRDRNA2_/TRDRNA2_175747_c1_seq3:75-1907(-)